MLRYVSVKNFALIENCEIDLVSGLNIITGETGAGKSIIIQAIAILLGGRANVEHIRSGEEEAVLNATIDITSQEALVKNLEGIGITVENEELIIRRILTTAGKSRSFINGIPVTSKEMSLISGTLFDFHGQHEGISLLKRSTHLEYLDSFLGNESDLDRLKGIYQELKNTINSLRFLKENKEDKEKRLQLLNYEIEEIESAKIKDGEDEELKREIKVLENIEKIMTNLDEVSDLLGDEKGIIPRLKLVKNHLNQLSDLDHTFNKTANDISDTFYLLEDISFEIASRKDHYNYEPGVLDTLIERIEFIEKLKRKYGGSIAKINEYLENARKELNLITFSSQETEKLTAQLNTLQNNYLALALAISKKRKEGALILEQKVKMELINLAMNNVEFKINFEYMEAEPTETDFLMLQDQKIKYYNNGIDVVEFLISPNKGEPLKSLIKIASGGELSRIILALKSVLVENDQIRTMIFDEIDAGIGGKVGIAVAESLKNLGSRKQIICITHLPQIASAGKKNFKIQKNVIGERTISTIDPLDKSTKISEIARMLSGQITDVSLEHARELIGTME